PARGDLSMPGTASHLAGTPSRTSRAGAGHRRRMWRPARLAGLAFATAWLVYPAAHAAPLVDAAGRDDPAAAVALLDDGADPGTTRPDGTTALHWAVYHDPVDLASRLRAAGADPNAPNGFGSRPLFEAAAVGNPAMIGLLLDAGADVEAGNADGQTALMIVA